MSRNFGLPMLVAITAQAALPLLPTQLTAEMKPQTAEPVPANTRSPAIKEAIEPPAKTGRKTKESTLEKLALKKLIIERPAPKKPPPE